MKLVCLIFTNVRIFLKQQNFFVGFFLKFPANVLQLGKVATVNDLRSQIYRKVRKKKPDFGEEMQTTSLTDTNQA